VWWYVRCEVSGVWRFVYYVGGLCFSMGCVGLCESIVYGECGVWEVVEF
jgi:hypothetical protein